MLATLLIVFREVLEAALIVGIVAAATRGMRARGLWISSGVGLGALGAVLVAAFAETISGTMSGMGQEWFNAAVLLAAVVMIGWHVVWMARHGRELAVHMRAVGNEVSDGHRPMTALMLVVALAVLREGSEVVLFGYGLMASGASVQSLLLGGSFGILLGVAVGLALYRGLLKIPMSHFFVATNGLLVLLAAGLASSAAAFLVQADAFPALANPLWNSDWLLSDQSVLGRTLHILIGYSAQPSGMQMVFYAITVVVLVVGMHLFRLPPSPSRTTASVSPQVT